MRSVAIALAAGLLLAACDDPEQLDGGPGDGGGSDAATDVPADASVDPPADAGGADAGEAPDCAPLTEPQAMPGDDIDGDSWETYARSFFATYCTHCHSVELTTQQARRFAPLGMNWDDEASVRAHLSRIRNAVGVTNIMPPGDPEPSCDERRRIVRWIDADAP